MLTRCPHERVIIRCPDGARIIVEYAGKHHGNEARLGFDAPANYVIIREELEKTP